MAYLKFFCDFVSMKICLYLLSSTDPTYVAMICYFTEPILDSNHFIIPSYEINKYINK
jgi:hypothetical protein